MCTSNFSVIIAMSTRDREAEEALYKDVFGESELLDLCSDNRALQEGSVHASPGASPQSGDGRSEASGSVLSDDSFFLMTKMSIRRKNRIFAIKRHEVFPGPLNGQRTMSFEKTG